MIDRVRPGLNSRTIFLVCIALACSGLIFALLPEGRAGLIPLVGLAGLAWAAPELLRDSRWPTWQSLRRSLEPAWLGEAWFGAFILGAALSGAQGGGRWGLALLSLCAALAAWDLQAFRRRVYQVDAAQVHLRAYQAQGSSAGGLSSASEASPQAKHLFWEETEASASLAEADIQALERAALERAHLRALGLASLAGLGLAGISFGLTAWMGFEAGLLVGLGLGLALGVILVALARLLASQG